MVLVVYQGQPSHILSMSFIEWPYALGTSSGTRSKTRKISPSKENGKYMTSQTSIFSKSIAVRFDFNIFLYFVNFKASMTINSKNKGKCYSGGC